MKKIINPTNERIEVQVRGTKYSVEANGTVTVPDFVADYWKGELHDFLYVEDVKDGVAKKPEIVEEQVEENKEVEKIKIEGVVKKSK